MQDVFAKALAAWSEFRSEASPLTWLTRIATHHCLNVLRAERAPWHQRFERETRRAAKGTAARSCSRIARRSASSWPSSTSETQQAAIHYFVDEMTLDEVAAAIGRSVPTVRKRLAHMAAIAGRELPPDGGTRWARRTHRRAGAAAASGPVRRWRGGGRHRRARGGLRRVPGAPQARSTTSSAGSKQRSRSTDSRRASNAPHAVPRRRAAPRSDAPLDGRPDAGDGGGRRADRDVPGRACAIHPPATTASRAAPA